MKTAVLAVTLCLALAAAAAPAAGTPAPTPATPSSPAPTLGLSRLDQVMIQAQENSEWMARRHSRLELRDVNRTIERMCDRLQDAERRMALLQNDPLLQKNAVCCKEIASFGDQFGRIGADLFAIQLSLRKLAEPGAAPTETASDADRKTYQARHAAMIDTMGQLQKHSDEFHAWVITKPAPRGLDEISRNIDLARQELHAALQSVDRVAADAAVLREHLVEIHHVHDRAESVLRALGDAQDRVATLATAS